LGRSPIAVDRNLGRVLDRTYRVVRLLAEGAVGRVYEGVRVASPEQRVALKLLLPGVANDPASFARFRREAEIASQLGHPHIVKVIDSAISEDGLPYMVMELLTGMDLGQRLLHGAMPHAAVADVIEQLGSALQAVHDLGVVHRDLKPQNIFLVDVSDPRPYVKLLDFGLSKIEHLRSDLTLASPIFGTPFYMAPELAEGRSDEVDHRVDIFATAVIAFQCLTGRLPFEGLTGPEVLDQICGAEPLRPTEVSPELPPSVDAVLLRGLAKRRSDRQARVSTLAEELCRALRSSPSGERPRSMSGELTPTTQTGLPEQLSLTPSLERPMPTSEDERITSVTVLDDLQAELLQLDLCDPDLTPRLTSNSDAELLTLDDRTPAIEPTPHASSSARGTRAALSLEVTRSVDTTSTRGAPRRRRWRTSRLIAASLMLGLMGLGATVAVLIIRSVPEDAPGASMRRLDDAGGHAPGDASTRDGPHAR